MKRLIAAMSLAVLANSAFAVEIGKPFEELVDVQRVLPNIPDRPNSPTVYPLGGSAPFEQLAIDRALPDLPDNRTQFAAVAGDTRSDLEIATGNGAASTERSLESPWANDYNVIAPAQ
jgi:hypothetical protein